MKFFVKKQQRGNAGGLSRTMSTLRKEFANYSVCSDKGDIPKTLKFNYHTYCGSKHRGLCAFQDRANYKLALDIGERINSKILDIDCFDEGDWLSITTSNNNCAYYYLAHQRRGMPKIALLAICKTEPLKGDGHKLIFEDGLVLSHCTPYGASRALLEGDMNFLIDVSVAKYKVENFDFRTESEMRAYAAVKMIGPSGTHKVYDGISHGKKHMTNEQKRATDIASKLDGHPSKKAKTIDRPAPDSAPPGAFEKAFDSL